jgi:hypothetical protein
MHPHVGCPYDRHVHIGFVESVLPNSFACKNRGTKVGAFTLYSPRICLMTNKLSPLTCANCCMFLKNAILQTHDQTRVLGHISCW